MKKSSYIGLATLIVILVLGLWWFFSLSGKARNNEFQDQPDLSNRQIQSPDETIAMGDLPVTAAPQIDGRSTLLITVRDVDTLPVEDAKIVLDSSRRSIQHESRFTRADGNTAFEDIPAGVYRIQVSTPMHPVLTASKPIRLSQGESRILELRIKDYRLSIRGRVLDQRGIPVSGLVLTADEYRSDSETAEIVLFRESSPETVSGKDGSFELTGLSPGEYHLGSVAADNYAATKTIVHTAGEPVVLRVTERRSLKITGQVTDLNNRPLNGARILSLNQPGGSHYADATGNYEILLYEDAAKDLYPFRFMAEGYREKRQSLSHRDIAGKAEVRLNASLEAIDQTVSVYGVIRDSYGAVITGEQLKLHSAIQRASYQTMSDETGAFNFPAIIPGSDYKLSIQPQSGYRDLTIESLDLGFDSAPLELVMQPLEIGRLAGQMLDSQGNPVPGVALWLRSSESRGAVLKVVGDSDGRFLLDTVPVGNITLRTRSSPRLEIEGIQIVANVEQYIEVILDLGDAAVVGKIIDQLGNPVGGAMVTLLGTGNAKSIRSQSSLITTTGKDGRFSFSKLAHWPRRLSVSADGFSNHQQVLSRDETVVAVRLATPKESQ